MNNPAKVAPIHRTYESGTVFQSVTPDRFSALPQYDPREEFNKKYDIHPAIKPADAWVSLAIFVGSALTMGLIGWGIIWLICHYKL